MNDDWRSNPRLAGMDRSKLDMLQNLAAQGSTKGANDMLPFLMKKQLHGFRAPVLRSFAPEYAR